MVHILGSDSDPHIHTCITTLPQQRREPTLGHCCSASLGKESKKLFSSQRSISNNLERPQSKNMTYSHDRSLLTKLCSNIT